VKESQFGNLSIESGEIYNPLATKENMFLVIQKRQKIVLSC